MGRGIEGHRRGERGLVAAHDGRVIGLGDLRLEEPEADRKRHPVNWPRGRFNFKPVGLDVDILEDELQRLDVEHLNALVRRVVEEGGGAEVQAAVPHRAAQPDFVRPGEGRVEIVRRGPESGIDVEELEAPSLRAPRDGGEACQLGQEIVTERCTARGQVEEAAVGLACEREGCGAGAVGETPFKVPDLAGEPKPGDGAQTVGHRYRNLAESRVARRDDFLFEVAEKQTGTVKGHFVVKIGTEEAETG